MPPLSTRDDLLKQVALKAVTSPPSLFFGTAAVLLVPGPTWPLGLAALAAETAWVVWRIRDPRSARAVSEELQQTRWRRLIDRLEDLSSVLDPETAGALRSIVESQERLLAMYGAESGVLPHTRVELTSLLQHSLALAEKRHQLQTYIATFRYQEVQRETGQLERRAEKSDDPVTRHLYEQATEQKRQELENYVRLGAAVTRIDGQLAAVRCTLDNMLVKVVRMQAADANTPETDPVSMDLNRLIRGVEALENSLNETLSLQVAAG